MKTVHGSHLYGVNTENSDMDYKGIFMPDLKELLLFRSPKQHRFSTADRHTKNTNDDVDEVYFALPEFINLAIKGEMIAIDMLHSDSFEHCLLATSHVWNDLVANRHRFYTKNMVAFLGYVKKQSHKYGVKGSRLAALEEVHRIMGGVDELNYTNIRTRTPWNGSGNYLEPSTSPKKLKECMGLLPVNEYCYFVTEDTGQQGEQTFYEVLGRKYQLTIKVEEFKTNIERLYNSYGERARQAKENEGIDWKALSHAIRACYQLKSIYENGTVELPLPPRQREIVLDTKLGKLDFTSQVQPLLEGLVAEVELLAARSDYPQEVDRVWWDNWLLKVYEKEFGISINKA